MRRQRHALRPSLEPCEYRRLLSASLRVAEVVELDVHIGKDGTIEAYTTPPTLGGFGLENALVHVSNPTARAALEANLAKHVSGEIITLVGSSPESWEKAVAQAANSITILGSSGFDVTKIDPATVSLSASSRIPAVSTSSSAPQLRRPRSSWLLPRTLHRIQTSN